MKKIVIVEDDLFVREELEHIFKKEGYDVSCITSFLHTSKNILLESPDLILLDLNLPGTTGFEICQELKNKVTIPILVLTSRDQLCDELHALNLGADDYLTKPCHKDRLLARVSNLLRRFEGRKNMLDGQGFLFDRQNYALYINNQSLLLPINQGKIMEALLSHLDEVVTKEMLFQVLWGTSEYIDENALSVNITRLKKTLQSLHLSERLVTVRGIGYRLLRGVQNENF